MKKLIIYTVLSIISLFNLYAQQDTVRDSNGGIIMKAMRDELQRNMSNLEYKNYKKPFFISYSIEDVHSLYINATLGAITTSDISHNRDWRIRVIIGDYKLTDENFEEITNSRSEYSQYLDLPLDNDY
jgi:hypothetical protein